MPINEANRGLHLLCLRGLARESGHWGDFAKKLQSQLPNIQVHFIDLPGTGAYSQIPSPTLISKITDFLRGHLSDQPWFKQNPPHLLALSMGAMVAWDWGERYPTELASLILINTSHSQLSPPWKRLRFTGLLKLLTSTCIPSVTARQYWLLDTLVNHKEKISDAATLWTEIEKARPVKMTTTIRQTIAAAKFRSSLEPPQIPTLILTSTHDQLVHSECSQQIAKKWDLPIRIHPTAGHDLPIDDTPWLIEQISSWVAAT